MNYDSFCETLCTELFRKNNGRYLLRRDKIHKNNGVILDAVCVMPPEENCSSVVYLEPLYELYSSGTSVNSLCASVFACLQRAFMLSPDLLPELQDFDRASSKISYRLVSKSDNEALLQDVPWVPFLDLAVVFYLTLKTDEKNQITALLHNQQAKRWELSTEDLMDLAQQNTPSLFPCSINRLEDMVLGRKTEDRSKYSIDRNIPALFVLSNQTGRNGAACMLYSNVIKDFADQMASDVLILPSSIHEVLLVPDFHTFDYEEFRQAVRMINRNEVPREDWLSDEIYLYSRKDRTFKIWQSPSSRGTQEKAGRTNP